MKHRNILNEKYHHRYRFIRMMCLNERFVYTDRKRMQTVFVLYLTVTTKTSFYHPPTKLREGNVFTGVCYFVNRGRVGISGLKSLPGR